MQVRQASRGFTLVELMVVIGIIVIILSVIMVSLNEARESTRDKSRRSDLALIEFALQAYAEVNYAYPASAGTIGYEEGDAGIDDALSPFWEGVLRDPINDADHHYRYDPNFECGGERYVAIAATLERPDSQNVTEVCGSGTTFGDEAYVVLIDGPLSTVSETLISNPQNEGDWWVQEEEI